MRVASLQHLSIRLLGPLYTGHCAPSREANAEMKQERK